MYAEYTGVGAGTYTFHVRAKDEAGNIRKVTIVNGEVIPDPPTISGGVSITGGKF